MDRDAAIDQLPTPYGAAVRLRDQGVPAREIADQLSIDPDAVTTFFQLADAKLADLERITERG